MIGRRVDLVQKNCDELASIFLRKFLTPDDWYQLLERVSPALTSGDIVDGVQRRAVNERGSFNHAMKELFDVT